MFTPVLQNNPKLVEGLGLQGFRNCQVQPRYACQNIVRCVGAVLLACAAFVCFSAGIVTVATATPVLLIIAGAVSITCSAACLFLACHWGYGSFLSCHQSNGK